jgi:hypothetical protein
VNLALSLAELEERFARQALGDLPANVPPEVRKAAQERHRLARARFDRLAGDQIRANAARAGAAWRLS